MDPLALRIKNGAKEGDQSRRYGPRLSAQVGLYRDAGGRARSSDHYQGAARRSCQGRGVASGYWFNFGGLTANPPLQVNITEDGNVVVTTVGHPDIGGSRGRRCANMAAAELLGIRLPSMSRTMIGDTSAPSASTIPHRRQSHHLCQWVRDPRSMVTQSRRNHHQHAARTRRQDLGYRSLKTR